MGKIKVIHIITRMDRGGSAQNTLLTCYGLKEKYEVMLIHGPSLESRMTALEKESVDKRIKRAQEGGVKVIIIPSLVRRVSPAHDLWAFLSLWRLMIKEKPTIVHTHTYKAGILGCWAAKMAGVRIIVHTPHGHVFYGHFSPLVTRLFIMIEKFTALIMDHIVALTQGERKDYIAFSVSNPHKISTIHSGVDMDLYMMEGVNIDEKKRSLGLNPKSLAVGTVGWLLPVKGPIYLLKAMARVWQNHPDITLVYVGKGDLENELREEAFRMGLSERVSFLGWREDIPEIMHILDILVLPSLNEGMGRVLVEAMAAGKPIVASKVGGIPDLVVQGENGLLVPAADTKALAKGIEFLVANSEKRREMGEKGRKTAIMYGSDSMVQRIHQLYLELLREKVSLEVRW